MNPPAITPAELVRQWRPRLRGLARRTGAELADIEQEAWLLAAAGVRNPDAADFVPRWLTAVERHARAQAPGIGIPEGMPEQAGGDDPEAILVALEALAEALAGLPVDEVIAEPRTAREIAQATGKSERQARRIKRKLEVVRAVQGDLFGGDGSEVTE